MKTFVWTIVSVQSLGGVAMIVGGLFGMPRKGGNYTAGDVFIGCLMLTLVGFSATYLWAH
jgi:heme/copper-type cytochrome/quinol oxidase subunit 1